MAALVSRYKSIPNAEDVKRFANKAIGATKAIGALAGAVATEPFTGRLLKKSMEMTDRRLGAEEAKTRERNQGLTNRYSPNK